MRAGAEIFHTLQCALKAAGLNTNVGDEGGFAPDLPSAEAALDFVMQAIEKAGYRARATTSARARSPPSEFFKDGAYRYEGEGKTRSTSSRSTISPNLVARYPIVSIEDGMAEDDWEGWETLTERSASDASSSATIFSSPM